MNCEAAQELLSADHDNEITGDDLTLRRAKRHTLECTTCTDFVAALRRADQAAAALGVGHRTHRIVADPLPAWLRWAIVAVGTISILAGVPMLLGEGWFVPDGVSTAHLVRDGALACVVGMAMFGIVYRPRWSRPLALVCAGVFLLQILAAVSDVAIARVEPAFEIVHLVGALAVVLAVLAMDRTRARIAAESAEEPRELGDRSLRSSR